MRENLDPGIMEELTPEQIAVFRKIREEQIAKAQAIPENLFTKADINAMVAEVEEEARRTTFKQRPNESGLNWLWVTKWFQSQAMRWSMAASLLALALFLWTRRVEPAFKQFAQLAERGGTNASAVDFALKKVVRPLQNAMGATNRTPTAALWLKPDFQSMTIAVKLADGTEISGPLAPISSNDPDMFVFQLAAKGLNKTGEAVEVEGKLTVSPEVAVKSASQLSLKGRTTGSVQLTKPAAAKFEFTSKKPDPVR